jgi:hypothetical protein
MEAFCSSGTSVCTCRTIVCNSRTDRCLDQFVSVELLADVSIKVGLYVVWPNRGGESFDMLIVARKV